MICKGTKLTLRPNKRYKNNPELNEDIQVGNDRYGDFQQCQVLDVNHTNDTSVKSGFFYCRIHTNLSLKVGDIVTVDKIQYVQKKGNIAIVAVTIEETSPVYYDDKVDEDVKFGF